MGFRLEKLMTLSDPELQIRCLSPVWAILSQYMALSLISMYCGKIAEGHKVSIER